MNFQTLKKELFYTRKAFFTFRQGFKYLRGKYKLAPKIILVNQPLEKPVTNTNLAIHLLSSHSDLVMLCWSLFSFYTNFQIVGKVYIHDDGTFTNRDYKVLTRLFPGAKILDTEKFLANHQDEISKYPSILEYRARQTSMILRKKLIDPYFVGDESWKLILDSDVLWFKHPEEIEGAINSMQSKSYMMARPPGMPVRFIDGTMLSAELAKFNSGIVLYKKLNFNLMRLSDYLNNVDFRDKKNTHFIEQAGYASCLDNLVELPEHNYRVKGNLDEDTVAKHYTSPRRVQLFTEGLPKISEQTR